MWNDGGRDESVFYPIAITLLMDIRDAILNVSVAATPPNPVAPDVKPEEKPHWML